MLGTITSLSRVGSRLAWLGCRQPVLRALATLATLTPARLPLGLPGIPARRDRKHVLWPLVLHPRHHHILAGVDHVHLGTDLPVLGHHGRRGRGVDDPHVHIAYTLECRVDGCLPGLAGHQVHRVAVLVIVLSDSRNRARKSVVVDADVAVLGVLPHVGGLTGCRTMEAP